MVEKWFKGVNIMKFFVLFILLTLNIANGGFNQFHHLLVEEDKVADLSNRRLNVTVNKKTSIPNFINIENLLNEIVKQTNNLEKVEDYHLESNEIRTVVLSKLNKVRFLDLNRSDMNSLGFNKFVELLEKYNYLEGFNNLICIDLSVNNKLDSAIANNIVKFINLSKKKIDNIPYPLINLDRTKLDWEGIKDLILAIDKLEDKVFTTLEYSEHFVFLRKEYYKQFLPSLDNASKLRNNYYNELIIKDKLLSERSFYSHSAFYDNKEILYLKTSSSELRTYNTTVEAVGPALASELYFIALQREARIRKLREENRDEDSRFSDEKFN